jgi:hypothetical protein
MAINYLNNVDFNRNELQDAQLIRSQVENQPNDAAVGGTPVEGQLYFNTTSDVLKIYGNGSWSEVGGGVETLTTTDGTYIDLTPNAPTTGNVTVTADLSAVDGTAVAATRFLSKDNTWDVPVADNYGYWTLDADGAGATANIGPGDTADFVGGLKIGTNSTASGTLNITHDLQSQTNTTSAASPADGATFTVIDSVTVDSTGHTGGKNLKTITLPTFPAIPTVSNATITLTGGAGLANAGGAFTLNQAANEIIEFNIGSGDGITVNANDVAVDVNDLTIEIVGGEVAAKTAAVANAGTALATGDQIYDFVTGQIANIPSGLSFEGNWNANTDTPDLSGATPSNGQFWIVSVAGNTNLDGITDWKVGDWAIYVSTGAGTDGWQKVDNTSTLSGSGVANQLTYWTGTANVAGDAGLTYDATGNNLTVGNNITAGGTITSSGGNSGEWNSGYDNMITGLAVTGTTTKTLTATQQDGGTLAASWTDNDSGGTVTNIATSGPITGGPITSTGTIGITTASSSAIGAGNVAAATDDEMLGIDVGYASGTAQVGLAISAMTTVATTQDASLIPIFDEDDGANRKISVGNLFVAGNAKTSKTGAIAAGSLSGTVAHNFGQNTLVQTFDTGSGATVFCDVVRSTTTPYTITATISATQTNAITILVQKIG